MLTLVAVTYWVFVFYLQELISRFQLHSFDIRTPFRQILAYRQWKAESEVSLLILEQLHPTPGWRLELFKLDHLEFVLFLLLCELPLRLCVPVQGYQIMNILLAAFRGDVQTLRR